MNNLKSYTEYAVTSSTRDFVIGFEFNYGTDAVNVTVDNVPATEAGYTVVYLNSTTIRLNPAVTRGVVRLQRETDIDAPDNRFTAGAKFIASNMDENFTQVRRSQQEVRDEFSKLATDTYAVIDGLDEALELANDAAQEAQAAADTVNSFIVNGKVIADKVLDTNGKTQQEVNNKTSLKLYRDNETIYDHGAIGDGTLHTVEEWYTVGSTYYNPKYTNLASVQADYPFVNNKDFSIDQAAILKLANKRASTGGGTVDLSEGHFILKPINNNEMVLVPSKVTIAGRGDATIVESITDATDSPNTTVYWDMFLFRGANTVGGGARDFVVRQTGGRRNNACVLAQRQGANRQKFINVKFESAIASCIAAEGNVTTEVFTGTVISGCEFRPNGRHGVYLIGSYGNTVINNIFHISGLESIAVRAFSSNRINGNTFLGVAGVEAHAIALAQPPSGQSYKINNLEITDNKGFDLRGAFFYGQGLGTRLYNSTVSGNFASHALDYTGSNHLFQFYRTEGCALSKNSTGFSRNRAIQLYGCKDNNLNGTIVKNANGAGADVGTIILSSYTDPVEGVAVHSTGNTFSGCRFIDDRTVQKHVHAIQMLAGSTGNLVSRNKYIGGSSSKIQSADGLPAQNIGEVTERLLFVKSAMSLGTVAATAMTLSGTLTAQYISTDSFLKEFRLTLQQIVLTGTVTVRLYKNGSAIVANVLNADGVLRTNLLSFQPEQYTFKSGDLITLTIESNGTTSNQGPLDASASVVFAV